MAETLVTRTGPRAWWRIPIYPAAIPVAVIVSAWAAAAIHPAAIFRPLAFAVVASFVLTLVMVGVCRSRDLGALAATGLLVAILASAVQLASLIVLLAVGCVVLIGLKWRGRPWPLGAQTTRLMSVVAVVVVVVSGLDLVRSGAVAQGLEDIRLDLEGRGPIGPADLADPDIYLILLDGYPGVDARAIDADYQPSRLRTTLLARGFDMAPDTHSNCLQTTTTLASMMQMRHLPGLPELAPPWGPEPFDSRRLRRLINDAPALDAFHDAGYETAAIASGFAEVELRRVDKLVEPIAPTEFEISLLRGTGVGQVLKVIGPDLASAAQRGRINDSIADLAGAASTPRTRPRFVLAHIAAPHPPWVFGADGSARRDDMYVFYTDSAMDRQVDRKDALHRQLDQAAYIDGQIVDAVDRILADSDTPPVIVVFSDHGSGTGFDHKRPLASDLVERTSNILAAFTPGHPGLFATATTPIAILPTILNTYLDTEIPVPDDSVWAWNGSKLDFVRQTLPAPLSGDSE